MNTLLGKQQLASIWTLDDFESLARDHMSNAAYEYVTGGAGDGLSALENRAAFNRIRLNPRVMVDVSCIDTKLRLFGREHAFPILLAPAAYHKLVHPEGELETVKGADLSESTLVAACFSTVSYEAMRQSSRQPLWFQLYFQTDRAFTKDLVQRVLAAGCEAVCLCVDVPVNGPRDREHRAGFKLPPGVGRANLASLGETVSGGSHRPGGRNIYSITHGPDVTWKDVEWLRSMIPVPLLLKGILHPDDALAAADAGCDGVMVSNHGGRSLDTVAAPIDALPAIADRVGGRIPVILDSGVRRGIDVFKALARGAAAVMIGRSYLYGLAAGGALGVERVVEILRTELEMTMGLAGCTKLSEISGRFLLP
ncbi:MAG TPA: alpha-hydroxy acid oxidase [Bryobacteraceae bacterium]